jgi:spore coat polysaccharide biosynthesis protein SpsF
MKTVAIIQARMGSTRLPGKVMLPLNGEHVLTHDVHRTMAATNVEEVVVATTERQADDIIDRYARRTRATVFRGSETDVLSRVYYAARKANADIIVRITGDCPLISPETIETVIERLMKSNADYSTNILERTFPRGFDVEAFTFNSFKQVYDQATEPHHREHVTPYYHENDHDFNLVSVTADEVFDKPWMQNRTDLRLTLDEADDYELLRLIYDRIDYEDFLPVRDAVSLIDDEDLHQINSNIEQKEVGNASDGSR